MNTTGTEGAAATPAIEFRHVSFAFDELHVLCDVSFALRPNEMLFVTGASGSDFHTPDPWKGKRRLAYNLT
jgi:ABC-type multidrug transport system fused ATPase/permease subunit